MNKKSQSIKKEPIRPYSIAVEMRPELDLGKGPYMEGEIPISESRKSYVTVSNDKKNEEFHELFRTLPSQESLISG